MYAVIVMWYEDIYVCFGDKIIGVVNNIVVSYLYLYWKKRLNFN